MKLKIAVVFKQEQEIVEIVEILETNSITDGSSCCGEDLPCDSHQLHTVDEEGDENEGFDEGGLYSIYCLNKIIWDA